MQGHVRTKDEQILEKNMEDQCHMIAKTQAKLILNNYKLLNQLVDYYCFQSYICKIYYIYNIKQDCW